MKIRYRAFCAGIAIGLLPWFVFQHFTFKNASGSKKVENAHQSISRLTGEKLRLDNESRDSNFPSPSATNHHLLTLRELVLKLAESDLKGAIRQAEACEDPNLRGNLIGEIAGIWAKKEPEACFSWAKTLVIPSDKSSALVGMSLSMIYNGKTDDAIEFIKTMPKGELKDDMIAYGIKGICEQDLAKALNLSLELASHGGIVAACKFIATRLAEIGDFAEAGRILNQTPEGEFRESLNIAMISYLSEGDPEMAFSWFRENPGFSDRAALCTIASAFAAKDPLRGIQLAGSIEDKTVRQDYLSKLGVSWGRNAPKASTEWIVKEIQDGKYCQNRVLFDAIIAESMQWEHDSIFKTINAIDDEKDKAIASLVAAKALASFDPQAAVNIVERVSKQQEGERISTITAIATNWMNKDPMAASKWIGNMEVGSEKDSAISALISNMLSKSDATDMARQWAAQINSTSQRNLALARIEEKERR